MNDTLKASAIALYLASLAVIFVAMRTMLEPNAMLVLLNSVLIGTLFSFVIALWPLTRGVLGGHVSGQDVGWFTIGLMALAASVSLSAIVSTMLRAGDWIILEGTGTLSPLTRYMGIVGLFTIVYAPDAGRELLHGRDRKTLISSAIVGVIAGFVAIYAQTHSWLR